jgi:NAD(P)-dependent dehydrogenase (short-subunit alcohol dehydrogenase family)
MNLPRAFDLTGKVAVITGAAGLLGPEHGAALAECGATVVLTDVNLEAVQRAKEALQSEYARARFDGLRLDVTDLASVSAARDEVVRKHRGVHILVNNAAIDPKVKPGASGVEGSRLENLALDDWNLQVDVGLTGAFLCCQAFGAWMAQHGGGVILNIASDLGVIAPDQRLYRRDGIPEDQQPVKPVTYSVIKTGLLGLTRYLATYWADQHVRANALSPGGVYTGQGEEFVKRLTNLIPMGRMAARDEYRAAVQFLCSDASRYMTGQNVVMDGGRSVL